MLIQPPNGGNCMLWTLGHLTESLIPILRFLDGKKPEGLTDLSRFERGSEPILGPEAGLMTASELMTAYEVLHQAVLEKLEPMTDADFDEEVPGFGRPARRGWMLFFHGVPPRLPHRAVGITAQPGRAYRKDYLACFYQLNKLIQLVRLRQAPLHPRLPSHSGAPEGSKPAAAGQWGH